MPRIAPGIVPATLEMMDATVMRAVEQSMPCGYPLDAAAVLIAEACEMVRLACRSGTALWPMGNGGQLDLGNGCEEPLFACLLCGACTSNCFPAAVRDLPELATSGGPTLPEQPQRLIATYHDPCHASRGQGLVDQPRRLLRSIPTLKHRELPEADWCCGGAGSYALSHFELARKARDRKIDNLGRTGAEVLDTSCPACIIHLGYGVRRRNLPVRVCHISELLSAPQ